MMNACNMQEICERLGKPSAYVKGILSHLGLHQPAKNAGFDPAYAAFLDTIVALRTCGISLDEIGELFEIEKKILRLLKVDSLTSSPTWYLDQCGKGRSSDRLLLTNFPLGGLVGPDGLQGNLDFAARPAELFHGPEMGEDVRRVFGLYSQKAEAITRRIEREIPVLERTLTLVQQFANKG